MTVAVWDEEQVLGGEPPTEVAVRLWAETARALLGPQAQARVTIDCDDPDTEMRLRVAGFHLVDVDAAEELDEETTALENEGELDRLLAPVLRLSPEAPLGALAVGDGKGVDLDLGVGLDVWGAGALDAIRRAAAMLDIVIEERPAEE